MLRILVVDEEPTVRAAVSMALRRAGHDAVEVGSGKAGLRALQDGGFDAVVTDVRMLERTGVELLRALRAIGRPVPVLAMSGGSAYGADGVRPMVQLLDAEATLSKPFVPAELVAAVEAIAADAA
jgi:CheY-like chemotaxis protein